MAAKARLALDPVADLRRRLGRKPGALRSVVRRWWRTEELDQQPAAVGKRIAIALVEQRRPDLKLAGIIVLHELLAEQLRASDMAAFGQLFEMGHLADGIVVDAFAARVLATMLHGVRGRSELARVLVQWGGSEIIWQRRAACTAFAALARQGDAAAQIFMLCSTVVWSIERVDQSAVATLLRELSRAEPTRVEAFVRRHARFMSRECIRTAISKLPTPQQHELLAHWKRATKS